MGEGGEGGSGEGKGEREKGDRGICGKRVRPSLSPHSSADVAIANEDTDEPSTIDTTASQCVFVPSAPASPTRTEHVALPHPPQLVLPRVSIAANRTPTIPPKHFRVFSISGRSLNASSPSPFFISSRCCSPTGNIDILALLSQLDSATPFVLHSFSPTTHFSSQPHSAAVASSTRTLRLASRGNAEDPLCILTPRRSYRQAELSTMDKIRHPLRVERVSTACLIIRRRLGVCRFRQHHIRVFGQVCPSNKGGPF
ncbi:hypothetical protein BLNAU_11461 [Blattamonas nauphoetae]|uniref:Uncharacterized protein n=1 Tax=Blattamonas nauphoetae TaxID=2049346 RepID=A0ABQ9XQD0_9EUKA|nr:hypothetical protein BLNAU_11461 [Blattamonas nauphoetae]